jgi:cell division protein FtsL
MINLLPQNIREERQFGRRNRLLFSYVVALLVTAGLVAAVLVGSIGFVGRDEAKIKQEIADSQNKVLNLEGEIKDLSSVATRLTAVDRLYESSISFSELIPEIGSLLPQGSVINGLSLAGGNTDPLTLDVNLISADLAPVLQQNLIQSELFEAADVNSITPRGDDTDAYKFGASVSVSFTGTAEAKRKIAAQAAAAKAAKDELEAQQEEGN